MTEWRPVPGHSDYTVSDDGRVRSYNPRSRYRKTPGRELTPFRFQSGHLGVHVRTDDGRRSTRRVHALMMAAFVGPRPDGMDIRHLDGDPTNNRLDNLAYGTRSENVRDSMRHGTHIHSSKTHCKHGHAFDAENTRVDAKGTRHCRACARARDAVYRRAAA